MSQSRSWRMLAFMIALGSTIHVTGASPIRCIFQDHYAAKWRQGYSPGALAYFLRVCK